MSYDDDLIDWIAGGQFNSPEHFYNMKKKALEADTRVNKPKTDSVNSAYREYLNYKNSDTYRNTERAKHLLSSEYETTNEALQDAMQRSYGLDNFQYTEVLNELANSNDVNVRMSLFDHKIKIKKLK
ncbi:MAG: hypothetical protein ACM3JQ_05095 [Candidatus Eiseniibacteriota bacterium]